MDDLNSRPFVSTPIIHSSEEVPEMVVPSFSQTVAYSPSVPAAAQSQDAYNLYPDIYHEVYPAVADAVDKMISSGYTPTSDAISVLVDNIIKNSGLWYEDDDDDPSSMGMDIIPVQGGFGQRPFHRRRRMHHNRNTLRDLVRILLLRDLFSRGHGFQG